jgi:hypothetical protein
MQCTHSNILDVCSSREANCNTGQYLVVGEVLEKLISKRPTQKFDVARLSLKTNDMEVKEQYQVKISYRFAELENLDDNV